jgi:hypothetical protein
MMNKPLALNPAIQSREVVTQSVDAVKALLAFVGRASDPLPVDVALDSGRVVLVLNGKKDAYYTSTSTACSCPAAHWHKGPCKHVRKYFPQQKREVATEEPTQGARRLARQPEECSLRPTGKWPGGFNGPVDLLPSEERAAKASLSAIDCHDTTPQDVAYWSIQEDKTMWPAEA